MTKIEQFLIEHSFGLVREHPSGVIVYHLQDEDGFYGYDEIVLFPKLDHWELHIASPDVAVIDDSRLAPEDESNFITTELALYERSLVWALNLNQELNDLENPWEKVDDEN